MPANTVAELVAHSRTVPQKMNFASAGVGSVSHLTFEVFKDGVGMEAVHIPYKGGGQAIGDVIAGHVADDDRRRCRSPRAWSRPARSRRWR